MSEQLLSPFPEAADRLGGVCRATVYNLIRRGELAPTKVGRRTFITESQLDAYIARNTRKHEYSDSAA